MSALLAACGRDQADELGLDRLGDAPAAIADAPAAWQRIVEQRS